VLAAAAWLHDIGYGPELADTEHCNLGGDPRLQRLQQRPLPREGHLRRAVEHFTDCRR
jgi:hypothetical protein